MLYVFFMKTVRNSGTVSNVIATETLQISAISPNANKRESM